MFLCNRVWPHKPTMQPQMFSSELQFSSTNVELFHLKQFATYSISFTVIDNLIIGIAWFKYSWAECSSCSINYYIIWWWHGSICWHENILFKLQWYVIDMSIKEMFTASNAKTGMYLYILCYTLLHSLFIIIVLCKSLCN